MFQCQTGLLYIPFSRLFSCSISLWNSSFNSGLNPVSDNNYHRTPA